jgi:hypothetical protein
MSFVIKIEWLGGHVSAPSRFEGSYVSAFDPEAHDGRGSMSATFDKSEAKKFDNAADAMEFYRQQSKTHPIRETDGKPNRPLTAYTVSIETVD